MSYQKKTGNFLFVLLVASLILLGCKEKNSVQKNIYQKPVEEGLDSLTTYFSEVKNISNKEYLPAFYKHFNEKIGRNKWEKAAQILWYAGRTIYSNEQTDSLLLNIHIAFIENHAKDISDRYKSAIYINISNLYYYGSDIKKAIFYLKKVATVPSTDYYTILNIATAYKDLCYNYTDIGQPDSALIYGYKGLDISTQLKDAFSMGANYDAIGVLYKTMNDSEKAYLCFDKAIKIFQSVKSNRGAFSSYLNKLNLLYRNDDYKLLPQIDSMYHFYKSSNLETDSYKIYAESWYAYKLIKENKLQQAKIILDGLKVFTSQSEHASDIEQYLDAVILYDKQNGSQTLDRSFYLSMLSKYKAEKLYQSSLNCLEVLKQEAISRKDYKTALYFQGEYEKTSDSLTGYNLKQRVKEFDKKYETKKKEQQIAIQENEISQKNNFIALLVASLSGLIMAIIAFYLWQKQKILKQQKYNSMTFTKQLLENTEEERKRIASDLHDSISHELLNLKFLFKQDIGIVNSKIDTIINDIRGISRNLHPVMFDRIGLVPNIEAFVARIQDQHSFFISAEIDYNNTLTSADELQLYRIVQESLTNIIKYAKAHAAKITILDKKDSIFIEIRDNGKGFNVEQTLNSGKAFGLHSIIERSRVVGGEAMIKSSNDGTVITINIPKKS